MRTRNMGPSRLSFDTHQLHGRGLYTGRPSRPTACYLSSHTHRNPPCSNGSSRLLLAWYLGSPRLSPYTCRSLRRSLFTSASSSSKPSRRITILSRLSSTRPSSVHINFLHPADERLHKHRVRQQSDSHSQLLRLRRSPRTSLRRLGRRQRKSSSPRTLHVYRADTNIVS
jgi:hypothetical protein